MFQKQSETTWLQLGLDNRNANNEIQCTRSTNSTANRTIKLWKCKTKHNSHKTIGNLKEHSWLWSSIFWYEELALDIGWTFGDEMSQTPFTCRCLLVTMGHPTFDPTIAQPTASDWSPNPTWLITGPIRPTIPNRIHIRSAVLPQCTKQTDRHRHTD